MQRPAIEYFVRGADAVRTAETWPPAGVRYVTWHLSGTKSGSVTSLNDGALSRDKASGEDKTSYTYPNPGWMMGVVGFGPNNAPDPARRVLTFTTAPLEQDLEIAGPIKLTLYASSTRNDMDFFVKLSEQMPQSAEDRGKTLNPASFWITKGWLRASHRALDPQKSTEMEPYHTHTDPQPIEPGKIYRFDISVEPMAHRFKKGSRRAAGNRQRRLGGHRRAVDALLHAEQDRHRHDLSFGGASFGADPAGDGRRIAGGAERGRSFRNGRRFVLCLSGPWLLFAAPSETFRRPANGREANKISGRKRHVSEHGFERPQLTADQLGSNRNRLFRR